MTYDLEEYDEAVKEGIMVVVETEVNVKDLKKQKENERRHE